MYRERLRRLYDKDRMDVREAFSIQRDLSRKVIKKDCTNRVTTVAGADLAVSKHSKKLLCGIVVFSFPELEIIEKRWEIAEEKFPYIPTLLAFREGPAVISTFGKLSNRPDVLIMDGQGLAHPRKFGIACHVGVLLDIPTMGIAKKRLYGDYKEPSLKRGSREDLVDPQDGSTIGAVVRTRDNVKPVFVSVGNKLDLETAVGITLSCNGGYKVPEPTRIADGYVAELKKEMNL